MVHVFFKIDSYIKILNSIRVFALCPNSCKELISIKEKTINTTLIFALLLFCSILTLFLIKLLIGYENIGIQKMKENFSYVGFVFFASVLIPIIEETIYRLYLIFKPIYISISFTLFVYIKVSHFAYNISYLDLEYFVLPRLGISIVIGVILYIVTSIYQNQYEYFWNTYFKYIFYFSIVIFGFSHITNFEITLRNILFAPLLTLPQSMMGLAAGFVRVKYGFAYSCLLHASNNLIPSILSYAIIFQ